MCRTPLGQWSVTLLLLLLAGCATTATLELSQDVRPEYVKELRAEFVRSYPYSPYQQQVKNGEVVAGMDMFGVLAAWGRPANLVRQSDELEKWVYYDVDDVSGDALEYDLLFWEGVLSSWKTRVHRNNGLAYRADMPSTTPVPSSDPPAGKRVPPN